MSVAPPRRSHAIQVAFAQIIGLDIVVWVVESFNTITIVIVIVILLRL